MIPFDIATFRDLLEVGFSGGPRFEVIPLLYRDGREVRTSSKRDPSHAYNVSPLMRTQETIREVLDFWVSRGGSARAFRFRDWHDCSTSKHDDITIPTVVADTCGILVDSGGRVYELWKEYEDDDDYIYQRRIRKPRAAGFRVFNGESEVLAGWSLNTNTGIVTSAVDLTHWIGEFDVPVRFSPDTDDLTSMTLEDFERGKANLILEEVLIGQVPLMEEPDEDDPYDTPTTVSNPAPGDGPPTDGGSDGGDGGETGGNDPSPEDNEPPPPPETCSEAWALLPETVDMRRLSDDYTETLTKVGESYYYSTPAPSSWEITCSIVEGSLSWHFVNMNPFFTATADKTGTSPLGTVEMLASGEEPGEGTMWSCE